MIRYRTLLAWILLCLAGETLHAAPATQPTSQGDPVAKAVQMLTKEARDAIRLKQPFPRIESDYFRKSPAKVDVVKLFEALIRPGPNPSVDGYVKWQLISILPERLSPEFERAGAKVLLLAPAIVPLPGATAATRNELIKKVEGLRQDEIDAFNRAFQEELTQQRVRAEIIIRYRTEFSAKLPIAEQCLKARLDELWTRGSYGYDIETEAKIFFQDIRKWKSKANPEAIKQMAATITDYADRPQPMMFASAVWNEDLGHAASRVQQVGFESPLLHDLAIELDPPLLDD